MRHSVEFCRDCIIHVRYYNLKTYELPKVIVVPQKLKGQWQWAIDQRLLTNKSTSCKREKSNFLVSNQKRAQKRNSIKISMTEKAYVNIFREYPMKMYVFTLNGLIIDHQQSINLIKRFTKHNGIAKQGNTYVSFRWNFLLKSRPLKKDNCTSGT